MGAGSGADMSWVRARLLYATSLTLVTTLTIGCPPRNDPGGSAPKRSHGVSTPVIARATAFVMNPGGELGGPNATGRPGDWVLGNAEVVLVFDQLGSSAGFAESGGNLVDAADARERKDELGQVFTYFGAFPRQAVYTRMAGRDVEGGAAEIVVEGEELFEPEVAVRTVYRLGATGRALLITTSLVNHGARAIDLGLGDAIQWGGTDKVAPGKASGFKGPSRGAYVGGVGRFASYGIAAANGEVAAINGSTWTDTEQRKVRLEPGSTTEYERVFVVGERADEASIITEFARRTGGLMGSVEIALVDEGGRPMGVPRGARAAIFTPGGGEVSSIVSPGGSFSGAIPPGSYEIAFSPSVGRRGRTGRVPLAVREKTGTQVTLPVSAEGHLATRCVLDRGGPCPCKVTVEGVDGTVSPDFGPAHAAGPAKNTVTTETGLVDVPLAPGTYLLTASHGPEFLLAQETVAIGEGAKVEKALTLSRVVDTTGYIAADFHQHTMVGADAPTGTRDRVISNVAEGVEIAVASEHNAVADLDPIVRALGMRAHFVSIPGNELTTDASRTPWGHANVFPLVPAPTRPRGGATVVRDRSAHDVFEELRKGAESPFVLQINHPRTGKTGYFDALGFDPLRGEGAVDKGYDGGFDAVEIWNGRNAQARDEGLPDFLGLLRASHPTTPTGNTDTHGVVGQEAGYPRTYVRVTDDSNLGAWNEPRTRELVGSLRERRDVVLTNGPFLRVSAGGQGIGGVVRGRTVEVLVTVEAAPWVDVSEVELRLVTAPKAGEKSGRDLPVQVLGPKPVALEGHRSKTGQVRFRVTVDRDAAFVAIARGKRPLTPVLSGDPAEIMPYAITGAIWIDADNDGKSLGRASSQTTR